MPLRRRVLGPDDTSGECFGTLRSVRGGERGGEFEEDDPSHHRPLLPPDDRLWRHPSEIDAHPNGGTSDPSEVRTRWLEREATRANAWTAGLVGALLATGIVLVGTHLAAFMTRPPVVQQTASNSPIPSLPQGATLPSTAHGYGLGGKLAAAVERIGSSTVSVHAFRGSSEIDSLGLVMPSSGDVLVAAGAVKGTSSILVEPPDGGVDLVAAVDATDARSGLAVLHVNGMVTPPADLDDTGAGAEASTTFALAVTSAGGSTYAPASLTSTDVDPTVDGGPLVDGIETDLAATYAPLGSPVLGSSGTLIGMVVGSEADRVVLSPSWMLGPISSELDELGGVSRGWMGINGATVHMGEKATQTSGVRVEAVTPRSAAARGGLGVGDVIVAVDANPTPSITALQGHLYVDRPGTTVTVSYLRKSHRRTTKVTLARSLP